MGFCLSLICHKSIILLFEKIRENYSVAIYYVIILVNEDFEVEKAGGGFVGAWRGSVVVGF